MTDPGPNRNHDAPTDPWLNRDRFCKQCRFNLRGLGVGECPECGLVFNVRNPRTVLTSDQIDPHPTLRRVAHPRVVRLAAALALMSVPALISLLPIDVAVVGYLVFIVGWPLLTAATAWLLAEALLPEQWAGISVNLAMGCLAAGLAGMGQTLFLFHEPVPHAAIVALALGLPVGLLRAIKHT